MSAPARKSRIAILRERVAAAERARDHQTYPVPFRGTRRPLTIIKLEISFPLYRIKSGRTHRAHTEYLESHPDLPQDFFDDPEDPRVQSAQHEILLRLIQQEGLAEDLSDRKQLDPIVLTFDGFIVDGNRRVAALREAKEEFVLAVVLPDDADRTDLYETELELQMARATKAEYNWVDELLHIRYGHDVLKEKVERIAKRMRKKPGQVREALERLNTVDMYLFWLGRPGQYHLVPTDEAGAMKQAFTDLTQRIRRLPASAKKPVRQLCFCAIKERRGYKEIRRIIRTASAMPEAVLSRMRQHKNWSKGAIDSIRQEERAPAPPPSDPMSDLASFAHREPSKVLGELEELANPSNAERIAPILVETVGQLEDENKDLKAQRPLRQIEKALTALQKIELGPGTPGLSQIAKALDKLDREIARLAKDIKHLKQEKEPDA